MIIPSQNELHSERISSIDILRGFALLGILIMNIQSFAMPIQGYFNPFAFNGIENPILGTEGTTLFDSNGITYIFSHIFADQKFMTIFAFLYGVGIALMAEFYKRNRPLVNNKPVSPYRFLARRNGFLLLLGLAHAYLLWEGDILVSYAICGLFSLWFLHRSTNVLITIAVLLFIVPVLILWAVGTWVPIELVIAEFEPDWIINNEAFNSITATMRGGWEGQMSYRMSAALEMQIIIFLFYSFWRISGLILLGMAFQKLGLFHQDFSLSTLGKWACATIPTGWALTALGIYFNEIHEWETFNANIYGSQFNYFGSLIAGLGYVFALLYLIQKIPTWLSHALQSIGRTALSNYILQSLICAFIFYGYGLGMFAKLDRTQQLLLVPCIWLFQSILSILYLKQFAQGPLEWVWRSLTRWSTKPIAISDSRRK